jgi:septum formation protein
MVPDVRETWSHSAPPGRTAVELAKKKARKCREKSALVIAMDTIVTVGKRKLGKPEDAREAKDMLNLLSGHTHQVITGCALKWNGRMVTGMAKTLVEFRRIKPSEVDWYLATGEPFGKAGAYAIQGVGRIFINKIEGCYYNVVGFPLALFQRLLRRLGLTILDLQYLSGNG